MDDEKLTQEALDELNEGFSNVVALKRLELELQQKQTKQLAIRQQMEAALGALGQARLDAGGNPSEELARSLAAAILHRDVVLPPFTE